jgi:hypothetical protein
MGTFEELVERQPPVSVTPIHTIVSKLTQFHNKRYDNLVAMRSDRESILYGQAGSTGGTRFLANAVSAPWRTPAEPAFLLPDRFLV